MRTLVWRRLDEPGMEVAHVESFDRANGVQIGRTYELRWALEGPRLDLELDGAQPARVTGWGLRRGRSTPTRAPRGAQAR
jgi:hypothetical protein